MIFLLIHPTVIFAFFPYDERFIQLLKASIPANKRAFVPLSKYWSIDRSYEGTLKTAIKVCFGDLTVAEYFPPTVRIVETAKPSAKPKAIDSCYKLLEVAPDASKEVIEAAYKALVKRYHPDRGGTHDQMIALNDARTRVLKMCKEL